MSTDIPTALRRVRELLKARHTLTLLAPRDRDALLAWVDAIRDTVPPRVEPARRALHRMIAAGESCHTSDLDTLLTFAATLDRGARL